MVVVENLFKSYGKLDVLEGIHLTFESGKINGIAGRNGAGKTTLFKCIAGLLDFGGQVHFTPNSFRRKIGFLPADPYFMTWITGREYLKLQCIARGITVSNYDAKNVFDLPLDQYASTYSTGMKKKLALTGVLLQENNVFLLDEPFNGVDIQSNVLIVEIIKRLRNNGKIIILSSHMLGSLSELCDQIHILDKKSILKSVDQAGFQALSQEMIDDDFQHKIDRLGL